MSSIFKCRNQSKAYDRVPNEKYNLKLFSLNCNLQEVIWGSFVAFQSRSTGEISGPEAMSTAGVGEKVIILAYVGKVQSIHRVDVAGWSWVKHIYFASVYLLKLKKNVM